MPESPKYGSRLDELFFRAAELSGEERRAFLDEECGGQPELRAELESLLSADEDALDFLEDPVAVSRIPGLDLSAEPERELAGLELGPWRLCEEIGAGGMGKVYRAERSDSQFDKDVAIKLLRPGLDTDELLPRFRSERQVLAQLEHPNIARLLDGGVTESGQPYIVMEYVEGAPIHRHAETRHLSIDQRLDLFLDVCSAVSYAHQKLIVHRDLKPGNILVDEAGRVKLLDFGIAKVIEHQDPDELSTQTGLAMMTPTYASPEQIRGEPVSTATDVYSLGVVLYELLTGERPYKIDGCSPAEVERILLEREPTRPSLAVQDVSSSKSPRLPGDRGDWSRRLSGDLDNIVSMALRKEPERRYPTVEHLAADIRRHLDGYPVEARPSTARYRAGKFVSRNRVAVLAAGALALTLSAAAVVSTMLFIRTQRAKDEAERQRATAQEVTRHLRGVLEGADPHKSRDKDLMVREMLDDASAQINELEGAAAASLHLTVGTAYKNVAEFAKARSHLTAAVDLFRRDPESKVQLVEAMRGLGNIEVELEETETANETLENALRICRELEGEDHGEEGRVARSLAVLRRKQGRYEESESLHRLAVELSEASGGKVSLDRMGALNDLAMLLVQQGRYEEALRSSEDALRLSRELTGERSFETAQILQNVGWAKNQLPGESDSVELIAQAIEIYVELFPEDHPRLTSAWVNYGIALNKVGRTDEAIEIMERQVELTKARFGEDNRDVATHVANLGFLLGERGDHLAAAEHHAEARRIYEKHMGGDHPWVAITLFNEASSRHEAGQMAEARAACRRSLEIRRAALRPDHPDIARSLHLLAEIAIEESRAGEAVEPAREAVRIREQELGEDHRMTSASRLLLVRVLGELGRGTEADQLLTKTRAVLEENGDESGIKRADELRAKLLSG